MLQDVSITLGPVAGDLRVPGGNYTNLYVNYVGADYHTSELPVVFGTASWLTGIQDTPEQASMGAFMRNAWAEFARDPEDGLANLGWPKYDPDGKAVLDPFYRLLFLFLSRGCSLPFPVAQKRR